MILGEPEPKWHFKREISTGDLILAATIVIAIGVPMLTWAAGITGRVSVLEERIAAQVVQEARDNRQQNEALHDSVARIEGSLRDIQSYLLAHNAAQSPQH